jgi:hypothetical protein
MKKFFLLLSLSAGLAPGVQAQSYCASDGQATPVALVEHFISADCEACWSAPPETMSPDGALTLDWIVPSAKGDEAPLSAAASRDALMRLDALGQPAPKTQFQNSSRVAASLTETLRVAHGLALGGYIGASIELKSNAKDKLLSPTQEELSAWLVLVESIPAGTDGTPTARNLVRNVLLIRWGKREQLSESEQAVFHEMRPLNIPQGARPERLRVVGWVQDASGRILSAAQSVCAG